jgi:hypothetical protein
MSTSNGTSRSPSRAPLAAAILLLAASSTNAAVGTATVEGPIAGGTFGRPFGTSSDVDPAEFGYVEEEFFLSGTATTYAPAPGTALSADGHWDVLPSGAERYRTRILVRRPIDAARFNGTVIVFWMNTSAGFDISDFGSPHLMRRGFAHAFVSAQRQSVEGGDILGNPGTLGLKDWDPVRYASLDVASTDLAFDIFSQAALAVGPERPDLPNDPMNGLAVERVIAAGGSQSAAWLTTYYDAVQPLEHVFDAFLIFLSFGRGNPLETGVAMPETLRFRTEVEEPVLVLNTENETLSYAASRQPDTDRFRFWEYAGLNHTGGTVGTERLNAYMLRELGFALPTPICDGPIDTIDSAPIGAAGMVAVDEWVRTGVAPAILPRIALAETPFDVDRDERGNARGGIRIPPVAVPTATHHAPAGVRANLQCFLLGYELPFSDAELRALYPSFGAYAAQVRRAARAAERAGVLLREDAAVYRDVDDPRLEALLGCSRVVPGVGRAPLAGRPLSSCAPTTRRTRLATQR